MILSEAGQVVHTNWHDLPNHFDYVELDSYVVMPNHFHAIILIHHKQNDSADMVRIDRKTEISQNFYAGISPKYGSLSTVIRSFKSSCTREINLLQASLHFKWQPRFHDHIIRDKYSHKRIRNYIINNPGHWHDDLFNR